MNKNLYFYLIGLLLFSESYSKMIEIKKFWKHPHEPVNRGTNLKTNYPFITGEEFRKICDVIFDETNTTFNTEKVKDGDLVFVKNLYEFLDCFFEKIHPHIKAKYILISHNGICNKNKEKYKHYLEDEKIIAWFGKNLTINHEKANVIPLGVANHYFRGIDCHRQIISKLPSEKKYLLYMNFNPNTNKKERIPPLNFFSGKNFCYHAKRKSFSAHLNEVAQSKFVLSPAGSGLDCHRTWESMLVESIPIIKTSKIDILFEDLPVLIIKNWNEVTEDFLNKKYLEITSKMKTGQYNLEKLYTDYWVEPIKKLKDQVKKELC